MKYIRFVRFGDFNEACFNSFDSQVCGQLDFIRVAKSQEVRTISPVTFINVSAYSTRESFL